MKKFYNILFVFIFFLLAYNCDNSEITPVAKYKKQILETESRFASLASDKGIEHAFLTFADDSSVLKRGDELIRGKDEIKAYFEKNRTIYDQAHLEWKPDFVDVAGSGDLAYSYGKYTFTWFDSIGTEHTCTGIFHTVWKKQADGRWLYVWD